MTDHQRSRDAGGPGHPLSLPHDWQRAYIDDMRAYAAEYGWAKLAQAADMLDERVTCACGAGLSGYHGNTFHSREMCGGTGGTGSVVSPVAQEVYCVLRGGNASVNARPCDCAGHCMKFALRVGQAVFVRKPSMHPLEYQDTPGVVSEALPGDTYNVERLDGTPVANGQPVCREGVRFGIVVAGTVEYDHLNDVDGEDVVR